MNRLLSQKLVTNGMGLNTNRKQARTDGGFGLAAGGAMLLARATAHGRSHPGDLCLYIWRELPAQGIGEADFDRARAREKHGGNAAVPDVQ